MSDYDYVSAAAFRQRIAVREPNTAFDDQIAAHIPAASRQIDLMTGYEPGVFAVPGNQAAETRYFYGYGDREVWIDPCLSITSLSTSFDGWSSTDSWTLNTDYWRYDGTRRDKTPYRKLIANPNGSYGYFPSSPNGIETVKVVGVFGIAAEKSGGGSSLPAIEEACFLITRYLWKLPDDNERAVVTPDGVILPGQLSKEVEALVRPYRRLA